MYRGDLSEAGRTALNIAGALVGGGLIGILAFLTWAMVFREIPAGNEAVLNVLLGILSANVGLIVGFFYGSNVANKRQVDTIETLAKTAERAGVALNPEAQPSLKIEPGETATVKAEDS